MVKYFNFRFCIYCQHIQIEFFLKCLCWVTLLDSLISFLKGFFGEFPYRQFISSAIGTFLFFFPILVTFLALLHWPELLELY